MRSISGIAALLSLKFGSWGLRKLIEVLEAASKYPSGCPPHIRECIRYYMMWDLGGRILTRRKLREMQKVIDCLRRDAAEFRREWFGILPSLIEAKSLLEKEGREKLSRLLDLSGEKIRMDDGILILMAPSWRLPLYYAPPNKIGLSGRSLDDACEMMGFILMERAGVSKRCLLIDRPLVWRIESIVKKLWNRRDSRMSAIEFYENFILKNKIRIRGPKKTLRLALNLWLIRRIIKALIAGLERRERVAGIRGEAYRILSSEVELYEVFEEFSRYLEAFLTG